MSSEPIATSPQRLGGWSLPLASARTLERVAPTFAPILCLDCYGTAFARVARAIHGASRRRDGLIAVDLRGDDEATLANLLRSRSLPRATLAIDGIERLDHDLQNALIRALDQERLRLISGTALAIEDLCERLQAELFAIASTVAVRAPALAALGEEIGAVAAARAAESAPALGRRARVLSPAAVRALAGHAWPGDAAELDGVLFRTLLAVSGDSLEAHDLRWNPASPLDPETPADDHATRGPPISIREKPIPAAAEPVPESDLPSPVTAAPATWLAPPTEAIALELAHQIKNPLVAVKTFVQSVGELPAAPPDLAQFCKETDRAIHRIDDAVEEMLAFARLGPPHADTVDVLEILRDSFRAAWSEFAGKEVTISGPNGASLPVLGDDEHLRQALGTLTRHLLESIEPRSTVEVAVAPPGEVVLRYREWGALTHLRGLGGFEPQNLPLAMLLARSALARGGSALEVKRTEGLVEVALRFATG
jgi:hypothetical protein